LIERQVVLEEPLEGFRLSPQQRRLWDAGRGAAPYRAWIEIRIDGELDPRGLRRALARIVDRHAILRTRFCAPAGGEPLQIVDGGEAFGWSERSGGAGLDARQEAERADLDLARGPLFQATLIRHAETRWTLLCVLPALCADLQTLQNLFSELAGGYAALGRGQDVPAEVAEYPQFAEWQNELVCGERDPEADAHWQRFTRAEAISLPLAGRAERPARFALGAVALRLDEAVAVALQAAARRGETAVVSRLGAGWLGLVWRLTGREEITLGQVCESRSFPELDPAFGLFAKVLPLSCRVRAGSPLGKLAEQVEAARSLAEKWQDWFIPGAVGDAGPVALPLQIEFQRRPSTRRAAGVSFSLLDQRACFEPFEMKLVAIQQDGRFALELQYDASLFRAADVEQLAAAFGHLLADAVARPAVPLADLGGALPLEPTGAESSKAPESAPRSRPEVDRAPFEELVTGLWRGAP